MFCFPNGQAVGEEQLKKKTIATIVDLAPLEHAKLEAKPRNVTKKSLPLRTLSPRAEKEREREKKERYTRNKRSSKGQPISPWFHCFLGEKAHEFKTYEASRFREFRVRSHKYVSIHIWQRTGDVTPVIPLTWFGCSWMTAKKHGERR